MTMIALTRAPLVTFSKISRENVRFEADREAIERSYGKTMKVQSMSYRGDALASITVNACGREICIDISGCGCEYVLKYQEIEDAKQVYTNDYRFYDMTRN